MEDEIGKYKKRTESNVSKSNKKSKHKHTYIKCIFHKRGNDPLGRPYESFYLGSYCNICGKINDVIRVDEELEKHKDLEVITIASVFDKYITERRN